MKRVHQIAGMVVALGSFLIWLGCNGLWAGEQKSVTPASTAKKWGASTKGGAQLWSENCMMCHNLRSPSTFSPKQWEIAVQHMRVQANLTAEEARKILNFLQSGH